jgi:RNA polymerase sigma factor (sigma-70 family)
MIEMNERRQDFELLQRFTRKGEQSAFADLVRRHLDLVFATALRKVADAGGAQEISQNVFSVLARKASRFAPDDSLPAWLYKSALLESKSWLRGEMRRGRREATAAELGTTMKTSEDQPAFHALVPLLDEALLSLREKDRTALLLRFYESHSLRDVGSAFGVSEDTAQKRVQSALEKLAEFYKRRGFKTATLAATVAVLQHTAAPASAAVVGAVLSAALKVAPPALVGLGALLARLSSLSRVQTAAVCVALVVVPLAWYLNKRQSAADEVKRIQTALLAAQNEDASVQAQIGRLETSPQQAVAQRNEAAAGAVEAARDYFRASHGFGGGLQEMVDLSKREGFDAIRTIDDVARFASEVPGAVGFTAHPDFERERLPYRSAHAVLWYTKLSPTDSSWTLYLFDNEEAQKKPGDAPREAALAAAETKISSKMDQARELIATGGTNGVTLVFDPHEYPDECKVALAVLRLGGVFAHTGEFADGRCLGCRSVVSGGNGRSCGLGVRDKKHWNCCGSTNEGGYCDYWKLIKAQDDREDVAEREGFELPNEARKE